MNTEHITSLFLKHKESSLKDRYITNKSIEPLLENFTYDLEVNTIGKSVLGKSIYSVKIGNGNKKILLWSQMHGNESTTTKAISGKSSPRKLIKTAPPQARCRGALTAWFRA